MSGALNSIKSGILSSLQASNVRLRRAIKNQEQAADHALYPLLFDPQTAGGLLASIPSKHQDVCLQELHTLGYSKACVIGYVENQSDSLESITIQT